MTVKKPESSSALVSRKILAFLVLISCLQTTALCSQFIAKQAAPADHQHIARQFYPGWPWANTPFCTESYTVQALDSCESIITKFKMVDGLYRLNALNPKLPFIGGCSAIAPGQVYCVSATEPARTTATPTPTSTPQPPPVTTEAPAPTTADGPREGWVYTTTVMLAGTMQKFPQIGDCWSSPKGRESNVCVRWWTNGRYDEAEWKGKPQCNYGGKC